MASDRETLLQFGFPEHKVYTIVEEGFKSNFCCSDKALCVTNNSGLQVALDWLEKNADNEEAFEEKTAKSKPATTCLKCNQCGKAFKAIEQAELHAARTSHDDFVEAVVDEDSTNGGDVEDSVGPVEALTEEEKTAKLAELRAKLAEKRAAREREEVKTELSRRTTAKEMSEIKRELELKEMKNLAEERRKEKMEDRVRREEIKRQIEEDRRNKKAAIEAEKAKLSEDLQDDKVTIDPVTLPSASTATNCARIQIKLPAPTAPLKFTFDSPNTQTLADLKDRITEETKMKKVGDLLQTFPTRVFTSKDDKSTLNELGLNPSASLILKQ